MNPLLLLLLFSLLSIPFSDALQLSGSVRMACADQLPFYDMSIHSENARAVQHRLENTPKTGLMGHPQALYYRYLKESGQPFYLVHRLPEDVTTDETGTARITKEDGNTNWDGGKCKQYQEIDGKYTHCQLYMITWLKKIEGSPEKVFPDILHPQHGIDISDKDRLGLLTNILTDDQSQIITRAVSPKARQSYKDPGSAEPEYMTWIVPGTEAGIPTNGNIHFGENMLWLDTTEKEYSLDGYHTVIPRNGGLEVKDHGRWEILVKLKKKTQERITTKSMITATSESVDLSNYWVCIYIYIDHGSTTYERFMVWPVQTNKDGHLLIKHKMLGFEFYVGVITAAPGQKHFPPTLKRNRNQARKERAYWPFDASGKVQVPEVQEAVPAGNKEEEEEGWDMLGEEQEHQQQEQPPSSSGEVHVTLMKLNTNKKENRNGVDYYVSNVDIEVD